MGIKGRQVGVYETLSHAMERLSMPIPECGCYAWLGGTSGKDDYGRVRWQEPDGTRRIRIAHRVAYELAKGPIPKGFEVDHLCEMPWCVNPDHLEAITPKENVDRKSYPLKLFCDKGHLRTATNEKRGRGYRYVCEICRDARLIPWRAKRTAKLTASGYWSSPEYVAYREANRDRINARTRARRAEQKEHRYDG